MKSKKKNTARIWKVEFNRDTLYGSCQCKMFEFVGIPCKHLVKLFHHYDIDNLPENFIFRRWTKNANSYRAKDKISLVSSTKNSEFRRITCGTFLANQIVNDAAKNNERLQ